MSETRFHIWRCSKCGKWSHAKKRPTKHQRWVYEGEPDFDSARAMPVPYDHLNGFGQQPAAHPVDCGPFDAWIVEKDWHYNRYSPERAR